MRKIKLEKITGVVALAYLVLIPVGAYYAWRKIQIIDGDLTEMWDASANTSQPRPQAGNFFRGLRAR